MKRFLLSLSLLLLLSCQKEKMDDKHATDNPYYDRAWYFFDKNMADSSFIYFNKAKEKSLKDGDSIKAAKCLINMAIISGDQGDYFGSQEISLSAIKYLNPDNEDQKEIISSNYNNLGKISHLLKKYDEANHFYLKAAEFSIGEDSKTIPLNNLAINLTSQKNYNEALIYFERLLKNKNITKDPITFSRILSNTAKTKWLKNPKYNALPEFLKALHIREAENDLWGQNASYAHLSDLYMSRQPDSALIYAQKMYKVAQKINSADDQLQALQKLIKLSGSKASKRYFNSYEQLDDSIQTKRNAAKNQFALIRYETEKNKADNLNLQKDVTEKKYQIFKQKIMLFSTLFLIVTGISLSAIWYRKRKQRHELETKNAIRESQLKTSKKVHDVVANGLYRVMSEIENNDDLDKENVLDKIDDLYEKSRNISYDDLPFDDQNFHDKISKLLKSFATEATTVLLAGNNSDLWESVKSEVKYEIEHVLQELMVNMRKHSQATNVVIRFENKDNTININYADNGIGIKGKTEFKNGLRNTGNRIDSINGEITFDTTIEMGLKIQITFPVN